MKGTLKFAVLAAMLLGLPPAGVLMAQLPASRYFEYWNALWWRSGCFEGEAEESRRA